MTHRKVFIVLNLELTEFFSHLGDLQAVQPLSRHRPVQRLSRRGRRDYRDISLDLRISRMQGPIRHQRDRTPLGNLLRHPQST